MKKKQGMSRRTFLCCLGKTALGAGVFGSHIISSGRAENVSRSNPGKEESAVNDKGAKLFITVKKHTLVIDSKEE